MTVTHSACSSGGGTRCAWLAGLATVIIAAAIIGAPAAWASDAPGDGSGSGTSWQVMATPGAESVYSLQAISCVTADDCTAVGTAVGGDVAIEHFDGSTWALQTVQVGDGATLSSVSCPAAGACTAVGYDGERALIMQQEGGSWSAVAAPPIVAGAADYGLRAISCADTAHCAAVGAFYQGGMYHTYSNVLVDEAWSYSATPSPGDNNNGLLDVSCASAASCIAVGLATSSYSTPKAQFLTARFDGEDWFRKNLDPVGEIADTLYGVDCVDANDCTAIGYAFDYDIYQTTVIEHFDGSSWTRTDGVPYVGTPYAISCATSTYCVAVGGDTTPAALTDDGAAWTETDPINPDGYRAGLQGVACPEIDICFAVGHRQAADTTPQHGLIETTLRQSGPVVAAVSNDGQGRAVVTGSGLADATAVTIGGAAATEFTTDSDTQLTVTVPDDTAAGDIVITTPAGTSPAWFADHYEPAPRVTGIDPIVGSDQGGETITISGSGFTGVTEVFFDGGSEAWWDAANFTVISDTEITATTPAIDWDGATDVIVSGPGGQSARADADVFTFGTATSMDLDADQWTIYPGEAATVTATVFPAPPGGTVTFADGSGPIDGCSDLPLSQSGGASEESIASCDVGYPTVRHTMIRATYSGFADDDTAYLTSSARHQLVVDQQPESATLAVSDSPTAGQAVSYTLTLSPAAAGGSVAFSDNDTAIPGCATRPIGTDGTATCTLTYPSAGNHTVVAIFSGTADFSPARASIDLTVSKPATPVTTATAVTATPASPYAGALVVYVASVSPIPVAGAVAFSDGDGVISACGSIPVATDGFATCLTTAGAAGDHTITAAYSGDDLSTSSAGQVAVMVADVPSGDPGDPGGEPGPTATSAALGASADPTAGAPVTLTATITPAPDDGTVTFTADGTAIPGCATALLDDTGAATCTATFYTTGSRLVVAAYSGDAAFTAATAHAVLDVVAPAARAETSTALVAAPVNPVTGQLVTLTATVIPAPRGGAVSFADNGGPIGGCDAVIPDPTTGIARCQLAYGIAGEHQVTATYSGELLWAGSTSGPVAVTAIAPGDGSAPGGPGTLPVIVTVGANPAEPTAGDTVTYTATVTPTPEGGTITFYDGSDAIHGCSALAVLPGLDDDPAATRCTVTYPADRSGNGSHEITAAFSGSAAFAPAGSDVLHMSVVSATTTSLTAAADPATLAVPDTYTATVTPAPDGGSVTFTDGEDELCADVVVDPATGQASCEITFESAGAHSVTATYSGSSGFTTSTATASVTALIPTSITFGAGRDLVWQFAYWGSYQYSCGFWGRDTCFEDYAVYKPAWDVTLHAFVSELGGDGTTFFYGDVSFVTVGGSPLSCGAFVAEFGSTYCTIHGVNPGDPAQIEARYSGDALHAPSTSAVGAVVLPYPSVTTVSSSSSTLPIGVAVSITATVNRRLDDRGGSSPVANGAVRFTMDGVIIPGCEEVTPPSGATFSCSVTPDTAGIHTILAEYLGTDEDAGSSAGVDVTVTEPHSTDPTTGDGRESDDTGADGTPKPPAAPAGVTDIRTGVSGDADGIASVTTAGVHVSASGKGAFTIGGYDSKPPGVDDTPTAAAYFDLRTSTDSQFGTISVTDCNLHGGTALYFWDGTTWVRASTQHLDATSDPPCITVTIDSDTRPSLAKLGGTVFAVMDQRPEPVGTDTADSAVDGAASTGPRDQTAKPLAVTGSDTAWQLTLGALLVAVGGMLVRVGRKGRCVTTVRRG